MKKHRKLIYLVALIVLIIILGFSYYIYANNHQPKLKPLYAGNLIVPNRWRQKALKLGYYCPSWNNNATSQIEVGSVCLKINH